MRTVSAVEAQTRASSSVMMATVTVSAPAPPYAAGMPRAGSSISLQASNDFHGNSAVRSASAAFGAIFSSLKVRRLSRKSRWTSVRAKVEVLTDTFSQAPRSVVRLPRSEPPGSERGQWAFRWRIRSCDSSTGAISGIQCDTLSSTSKVYGPCTHSAVFWAAAHPNATSPVDQT